MALKHRARPDTETDPACSFTAHTQARLQNRRTYAILGAERGGTSAIAGVARALSLPIGKDLEGNNEDKSIPNLAPAALRAYIKSRNQEHDVWGWKFPKASRLFPGVFEWMRNPYYIIVTRDPMKTVLSRSKWDGPLLYRSDVFSLNEALASMSFATSVALSSARPTMVISYDLFIENRIAGIAELSEFIGVPMPDKSTLARIVAYTDPGTYKSYDDFFGTGSKPK